jgi:hypothetical protein
VSLNCDAPAFSELSLRGGEKKRQRLCEEAAAPPNLTEEYSEDSAPSEVGHGEVPGDVGRLYCPLAGYGRSLTTPRPGGEKRRRAHRG